MKVLRLPRRTAVSFRPLRELDRAAIVTGASVSKQISRNSELRGMPEVFCNNRSVSSSRTRPKTR